MYAKIHLSKNGQQTYATLVGDNHEPVFTSEMYDDVSSTVHAIELVAPSIDRIIPDESITGAVNLMRRIGRLLDPISEMIDEHEDTEVKRREAAQEGLLDPGKTD